MQYGRQKEVLIIAYYFPPLGMGGVQRVSKFTKYLPEFDWSPAVVTVKSIFYYALDDSLLDDMGNPLVVRTGSLDPQRLLFLWGKRRRGAVEGGIKSSGWLWRCHDLISRWIFVPDSKVLWLPFALCGALRMLARRNVRILFTTSPPHSAHFVGLVSKIVCKRPWVADFRDQWTGGHLDRSPSVVHRLFNKLLERVIVTFADVVVTVTPRLEKSFRGKLSGRYAEHKFITITNGYDAADFHVVTSGEPERYGTTIVYCGSVSRLADPEQFLMALRLLVLRKPQYHDTLQMVIVGGAVGIDLSAMVTSLGLSHMVKVTGYVPHAQAIAYLLKASMLLMLLTGTESRDVIPGKTFEYIGSGKPILAIAPEGDMADMIRATGRGVVVPQSSTPVEIAEVLDRMLSNAGTGPAERPDQCMSHFERRVLAARLARVFDDLLCMQE